MTAPVSSLPITIAGLGWYLPEQVITSRELAARFGTDAELLVRATGVSERRYASGETSAGMAAAACRRALDHAGLSLEAVDVIIGASAAPQQAIPCTAALVQRELGAPQGGSVCFDVNATCLSFLLAMQVAAQGIAAGLYRSALVFSSEIASVSLSTTAWQSAALFGDAAAAAVLTASAPGSPSALWLTRGATFSAGADLTRVLGGGTLHHPNHPATTPEMNTFEMDGTGIYRQAMRVVGPFIDEALATAGWSHADVDLVVPHQASRHGIELLSSRLGFCEEQVFSNLALRGNCVAASIPLALAEAVHSGRLQRGQRALLTGTGAGLTLGALALVY